MVYWKYLGKALWFSLYLIYTYLFPCHYSPVMHSITTTCITFDCIRYNKQSRIHRVYGKVWIGYMYILTCCLSLLSMYILLSTGSWNKFPQEILRHRSIYLEHWLCFGIADLWPSFPVGNRQHTVQTHHQCFHLPSSIWQSLCLVSALLNGLPTSPSGALKLSNHSREPIATLCMGK